MKNAFRSVSFFRLPTLSPSESQTRRIHSNTLHSHWRALRVFALGTLCCVQHPLLGQSKPAGGYVQLYPTSAAITQGQTVQLRAAVMNPLGFELPNRTVTWKSSNAAVAGVSSAGLVTAVASGIVTITAKSGAALGVATITISGAPLNTAPVVTITAPADGASIRVGNSIAFTGTAVDLQDGNLSGAIVWSAASADDPNGTQTPLGTGASVSTSSLAVGSYLITASATDAGHLTGVAQIGIVVEPPCTITSQVLPVSGTYIPQLLQLDATGSSDSCGRPLQFFWYFASDTNTTASSFLAQANTPGNTNATPILDLQEWDIVEVGLQVCVTGTNECSRFWPPPANTGPGWTIYEGAALH